MLPILACYLLKAIEIYFIICFGYHSHKKFNKADSYFFSKNFKTFIVLLGFTLFRNIHSPITKKEIRR